MSGLHEQLLTIRETRGELTPEIVVEAATPKGHALHDRFEWNNSVAGPLYRRAQAAQLIRSVQVRYTEAPEDEREVRAFVAIPRADRAAHDYMPIEDACADEFSRQIVLRQAEREWKTLRRRYEHLHEFVDLVVGDLKGKAS